jgi:hypothetical protein
MPIFFEDFVKFLNLGFSSSITFLSEIPITLHKFQNFSNQISQAPIILLERLL